MSDDTMDPQERTELAERLVWLGQQNMDATVTLRAGGRALSPVEVMDLKLGVLLDLAFGPIPRVATAQELAERITDARLVFEVEWQTRLREMLERANKSKGGLVVPKSNGGIHLP